jgi:hypothetical protein
MRAAALACTVAVAACDTGVTRFELGPLDAQPACEEAKNHSDLPWIQTHIFDRSCASSSACHKDLGGQAANLSLSDGMSYASLVGADAQSDYAKTPLADHQWKRVVAGDPASSYLMVLIDPLTNPVPNGPTDPAGFSGPLNPMVGSMPQNAGELLCKEKRDAIQRWIAQGALEN